MDDGIIRMYIDEVFQVYDYDRNGTLDFKEVHNFFNELRFTQEDMRLLFTTIDVQPDKKITKPELFILFKRVWENPGLTPLQLAGIHQANQIGQNLYQANMPAYFGQQQQPPPQQYGQGYNQQEQYGQQGQQQYGQQQYGQQQYGQQGQQQYGQQQQNQPNPYGQQKWGGK